MVVDALGFNGASALLPRIGGTRRCAQASRSCFNGASALLPRIAAAASTCACSSTVLQRGLGIAAEDRLDRIAGTITFTQLQRGLGIAAEDRCVAPRDLRLWWRGFNGASALLPRIGSARRRRAARAARFNGASALLPRIGDIGRMLGELGTLLQRGLGIAAEDRPKPRPTCTRGVLSFNGASALLPRIGLEKMTEIVGRAKLQRGLGIAAEDRRRRVRAPAWPRNALQRGLGIAAEDRLIEKITDFGGKKLQRGLGIAAEDRQGRARVAAEEVEASTGPRHCCRGSFGAKGYGATLLWLQRGLGIAAEDRTSRAKGQRRPRCCFNGASALLPRIDGERGRLARPGRCFNGASALLPRIVCSKEPPMTVVRQLQRGLGIAAEDRFFDAEAIDRAVELQRGLGIAAEDRHVQGDEERPET